MNKKEKIYKEKSPERIKIFPGDSFESPDEFYSGVRGGLNE